MVANPLDALTHNKEEELDLERNESENVEPDSDPETKQQGLPNVSPHANYE